MNVTFDSLLTEAWGFHARLIQAEQYRDVSTAEVGIFKMQLGTKEYAELADVCPAWFNRRQTKLGERDVAVCLIEGTCSNNRSWLLEDDRGEGYLHNMATAIKIGQLLPLSRFEPIQLFKIGDSYWVASNGRHRVAAIRGMLCQSELTVRADVVELIGD